jgi:predicted GNAT family acetyltransferase
MGAVADLIAGRGEKPFLHVASENESAIALYKKLGFVLRRTMNLTVLGI